MDITEITMANMENVTINIDETGVMVNEATVVDADIFLSNGMLASLQGVVEIIFRALSAADHIYCSLLPGIIHVVSGVLIPSFVGKTIVDVAIEEASILAELIVAAGLEDAVNTTAGAFTVSLYTT